MNARHAIHSPEVETPSYAASIVTVRTIPIHLIHNSTTAITKPVICARVVARTLSEQQLQVDTSILLQNSNTVLLWTAFFLKSKVPARN